MEGSSLVSRGMKYSEISYEDCERRGYSSGVEVEGVGRFYSKIFQDSRCPEYWLVDKDGAVRHIERKNVDLLVRSWFDASEMKDIMAYLNTGKWYCW
jgi:hypothetical protein